MRFLLEKFGDFGNSRSLVGSPIDHQAKFESILPDSWQLQFQSNGDLGNRMSHFFRSNTAEAQFNILIGSDTPDLPESHLEECVLLMQNHDLVLGPCVDGGYYLIAMRRYLPEIFVEVEWSSTEVLSQTLQIAERENISYRLLAEMNDVDEVGDLQQLLSRLESAGDPALRQLCRDMNALEIDFG